MKKTLTIILLLLPCIFFACDNDDTFTVGVDLQASFEQDDVQLFLNGKEILNQKVETSSHVGIAYAGGVTVDASEGSQTLKVVINNTVVETASFTLKRNTYVGVSYDRQTEEVTFVYADSPFKYL